MTTHDEHPEDETPPDEGSDDSAESLPAAPTDDDAEVGDTDQHSGADA